MRRRSDHSDQHSRPLLRALPRTSHSGGVTDAPLAPHPDPAAGSAAPSALADRDGVLAELSAHVSRAWASFEHPRPVEPAPDADLVRRLGRGLPDVGDDLSVALEDAAHVLDSSVSTARPLFLAYVPSSALETGVLASALSSAYDANLATSAGTADLLDRQAVHWLAEFLGYPAAEGHFTSGGQTSNFTGLLAAREHARPGSREHGVTPGSAAVYASEEAHHSVVRAVEAAGLGRRAVRWVPTDDQRRMRPADLEALVRADLEAGVVPVAVVATAGTTLTGTVDPLGEIAAVCERHGVWLHVDGAYGIPAAATASHGHLFAGLARADSVTVDAHKWLGMPKSCSALLVRHHGVLRATFGHEEHYMLHEGDTGNPVDSTFEYSRPLRALRFWLSMRVHGAARFRAWLEGTLEVTRTFVDAVRAHPEFELRHDPMLTTVCFRHLPPTGEGERPLSGGALDRHHVALAQALQHDGRVFLAPAELDGVTVLRACFTNFRTDAASAAGVLDVISEVAASLR